MPFHPTAIARKKLSMPMRLFMKKRFLDKDKPLLDFGCGRGGDVRYLRNNFGYDAWGYDPYNTSRSDKYFIMGQEVEMAFRGEVENGKWEPVTCIYVLNVIMDIEKRKEVVKRVWDLADKVMMFAVRTEKIKGEPCLDGVITKRRTFQRRFSTQDIKAFLLNTLVAAGCKNFKFQQFGGVCIIEKTGGIEEWLEKQY